MLLERRSVHPIRRQELGVHGLWLTYTLFFIESPLDVWNVIKETQFLLARVGNGGRENWFEKFMTISSKYPQLPALSLLKGWRFFYISACKILRIEGDAT